MKINSTFPKKRLKKRIVTVAMNGGVELPVLANKLQLPLRKIKRWKQQFQGQIEQSQWTPIKTKKHLNLLRALSKQARIRSRVVKLKAALKEA